MKLLKIIATVVKTLLMILLSPLLLFGMVVFQMVLLMFDDISSGG